MRVDLEPAYLLSQRPYRETSQLVEIFSRRFGRVGVVARGVRGPKAKQAGILRPFAPLLMSWFGSGDLVTMAAVEPAGSPITPIGERIFFGWYVNELLLKLLQRHDPHAALFRVYEFTLSRLPEDDAEAALRIFEKRLLAELGYALPLTASLDPTRHYRFDLQHGDFSTSESDPRAYSGTSLIALRDENLQERRALLDARRLLRAALHTQLGGRELETPKLLRALRRNSANDRETPTLQQQPAVPRGEGPAG